MMKRILQKIMAAFHPPGIATAPGNKAVTQTQLLEALTAIPHWEKKIAAYNRFAYHPDSGYWLPDADARPDPIPAELAPPNPLKVNYGCGGNIMPGWLNVDLFASTTPGYRQVNLLDKHPFSDNSVLFGFSEDVLEHLTQAQSIFFLSELFRTLAPGGVLRLSFPGLEGVLDKHYSPATETRIRQGEFEAYAFWDHVHFYSKAELSLVANHIGFCDIQYVDYGRSEHEVLQNLDTRSHQIGLNTYVEMRKSA